MRKYIGKFGGSYLKKTIALIIGYIFYNRNYLNGISFEKKNCSIGWLWVLNNWFLQKIIGINRDVPWPVCPQSRVGDYRNIIFHKDDLYLFQNYGIYFQAFGGKLKIGRNCHIGPNVGLITQNHDVYNPSKHIAGKDIVIEDNCWIGMNSVILPGVVLGKNTVVGAGSVVTKSFSEGYCIIAGNPAKKLRELKVLQM